MSNNDRFLTAALEEGGQPIGVVGSTLLASAIGMKMRVSPRTVAAIIRGTTKLDAGTKTALVSAVDAVETDTALAAKDRQDATDTVDQIREELSEKQPDAKRVRRFVNNLAAISEPAAAPLREHEPIKALLAG
jgi:hypothetical protein